MRPRVILWALLLAATAPAGVGGPGQRSPAVGVVSAQGGSLEGQRGRLTCVQRWSKPGEAGVACREDEVLSGGGCTCPFGTLRSSYSSGQDGRGGTAWQCDGDCPQEGLKAVAMCCAVTAP